MVTLATDATLGLTNLDDEVVLDELDLEGELPAWLGGSLLRTGPARWDLGDQTVNHWFDGLAMLHRFTIAGGRVSYANRFLRSKAFEAAKDGTIGFSEFATDPCRSAFKRVASLFDPALTDNANVNVARIMGKWVALTETPMPVAFDPETLETLGVRSPELRGRRSARAASTAAGSATIARPQRNAARFFAPPEPISPMASSNVPALKGSSPSWKATPSISTCAGR